MIEVYFYNEYFLVLWDGRFFEFWDQKEVWEDKITRAIKILDFSTRTMCLIKLNWLFLQFVKRIFDNKYFKREKVHFLVWSQNSEIILKKFSSVRSKWFFPLDTLVSKKYFLVWGQKFFEMGGQLKEVWENKVNRWILKNLDCSTGIVSKF